MRARTASAVAVLVVGLLAGPAVPAALGDGGGEGRTEVTKSQVAKARAKADRLEKRAKTHKRFVLRGHVVEVVGQELTFTVHGGRYKALRRTEVTVTVAEDAKVTRLGRAALSDVVPGDKVVVKSRDFEISGNKHAELVVDAVVGRVVASPCRGEKPGEPESDGEPAVDAVKPVDAV